MLRIVRRLPWKGFFKGFKYHTLYKQATPQFGVGISKFGFSFIKNLQM